MVVKRKSLVASLIFGFAVFCFCASPSLHAALSTGADGAFIPGSSMTLIPGPNGSFNFTDIDIGAGITIDFDTTALASPIGFLALNDIVIDGVIDATGAGLHIISTAGSVSLSGRIIGDDVSIEAWTGGIEVLGTIEPTGINSLSPDSVTSLGLATSGVGGVVLSVSAGTVDLAMAAHTVLVSDTALIPVTSGTLTLLSTPVPPALWLLISALSVLGIQFRRRNAARPFV